MNSFMLLLFFYIIIYRKGQMVYRERRFRGNMYLEMTIMGIKTFLKEYFFYPLIA